MKHDDDLLRRSAIHAALGEPTRLAIMDELNTSDRSPSELSELLKVPANLMAHHLDVLAQAGLIERFVSSGDRRRRYVRLHPDAPDLARPTIGLTERTVLFVCTHNSARSQLAAAIWNDRSNNVVADSVGTSPADRVHPGAVRAAARRGLDLSDAVPVRVDRHELDDADAERLIITVCDRAHEELQPADTWLHWSIDDPVADPSADAFDRAADELNSRISKLISLGGHTT